jgi:hypothetical protein
MNEMALELLVVVLVGVALWAAVIFFIPSCTASLFRYRVWELRDAIVDDVFDDRLPEDPAVWDVVDRFEAMIVIARHLSMGKLFAFKRALRDAQPEPPLSRAALTVDQRKRLSDYEHDLQRALALYLTLGTPTGWALTPVLVLYVMVTELPGFLVSRQGPRTKGPRESAAHTVERRVAAPVVNRPGFWEAMLVGSRPRADGVLSGSM